MRLRDRALRRAIAHIEDRPGMPVTIRQLCAESGVSWRTLDYAFKERFGIGPKVYLRARRLHGMRRVLRTRTADVRIADVARDWDFWHLEQFAADYRKQFGELPSETRRTRKARAAVAIPTGSA